MLVYDIRDLHKRYEGQRRPANEGISLEIAAGEIFGLLGDNGAGKSTLVRQMVGLTAPTAGQVLLYGGDIASQRDAVPLLVGYMPQDGRALNNLTVGEALYFTAHLRGLSRGDARAERDRLLALWQIEALRDSYTPRLSGGQKRLLQLAAAGRGRWWARRG